jgi:hypothetical protein
MVLSLDLVVIDRVIIRGHVHGRRGHRVRRGSAKVVIAVVDLVVNYFVFAVVLG